MELSAKWRAETALFRLFNPVRLFDRLWAQRELIRETAGQEFRARYQGTQLGVLWTLLSPLLMLGVYTFVFGVIFKARWNPDVPSNLFEYALILFTGIVAYEVFSISLVQAPTLVVRNMVYVKKVVFPLEILAISSLLASFWGSVLSLLLVLAGVVIATGTLPWTAVFLPLAYIPLMLFTLGLMWFLAAAGVYLRDIQHLTTVLVQLYFFGTPILYPITLAPERMRFYLGLNPMHIIVDHFRRFLIFGQTPDWIALGGVTCFGFLIFMIGYVVFMKSKRWFADAV
ncbi:ABC transporter permease [Desulfovibrio inopinatus]|uniref:ABC transporter permease n=1 Tax=Desulfovibrio inopinatus TaxID=102109 RepID=UPI0003F61AEB|nr:ABC transporter permease [Desulfovibrio inopinatus]